jgi:hypothetical protein
LGAADINRAVRLHRGHDLDRCRLRQDDSAVRCQMCPDRDVVSFGECVSRALPRYVGVSRSGAPASVLDGGARRIPDCNVGNQKDALKSDLLSIL